MCKKSENIWENNPELRPMAIANCKSCTLGLKMRDCTNCKFSFALKVIEAEKIEISVSENLLIPIEVVDAFEISDEWIENNPDAALESLWESTL